MSVTLSRLGQKNIVVLYSTTTSQCETTRYCYKNTIYEKFISIEKVSCKIS